MRMWILNFLLLALAKSVIGCTGHTTPVPNPKPPHSPRPTYDPFARFGNDDADYNANRNSLGKLEPTLIDALRGSKKK